MAQPGDNLQAKLAQMGLDSTPEEFVASLPVPVQRRVEALQELHKQKDGFETAFRRERLELEIKYAKLYAPLFEERRDVVAGTKAVAQGEEPSSEADNGIPEFWLTVLLKCEITQGLVSEKDVDVLKYLTNITSEALVSEEGESLGFKLQFFFATNPYFSLPVLEKTYSLLAEEEGVLEKAEGTKIVWNAGKDVTVKLMKKKSKKGGKPQTKIEKVDSFFNFFNPPLVPDDDTEMGEEEVEQLQIEMETDYEIGMAIKEKLIPDAIAFYTGEAAEEEGYFMGDEDEDEDGEDDEGQDDGGEEDEDEDDDEDDSNTKKVTRGGGGGKRSKPGSGTGGAAAGGEKPECKQQ